MLPALSSFLTTFIGSIVIKCDIANNQRVILVAVLASSKLLLKAILNNSVPIDRVTNRPSLVPPLNTSVDDTAAGTVQPDLITDVRSQLVTFWDIIYINTSTLHNDSHVTKLYCNYYKKLHNLNMTVRIMVAK